MRLRHKKGIENVDFGDSLIKSPLIINRGDYKRIILEIGCGKGNFISSIASDNSDSLFVVLEYNLTIISSLVKKKVDNNINNLILICDDALRIDEYFNKESVDEIYLHFSDPWPKKRHHKRRLTYYNFLEKYKEILKPNGVIHFKSDHEDFFNDSLEYFSKYFNVEEIEYGIGKYYTEYELKKEDKNIRYLKGVK